MPTPVAALQVDVTGWLIARLNSTLDADVASRTPADLQSNLPFVRVVPVGGGNDGVVLDRPNVVFHCYGTDDAAARATAYLVATALRSLRGQNAAGAVITRVQTVSGPTWAPADDPNLGHAVLTEQIFIKSTF